MELNHGKTIYLLTLFHFFSITNKHTCTFCKIIKYSSIHILITTQSYTCICSYLFFFIVVLCTYVHVVIIVEIKCCSYLLLLHFFHCFHILFQEDKWSIDGGINHSFPLHSGNMKIVHFRKILLLLDKHIFMCPSIKGNKCLVL